MLPSPPSNASPAPALQEDLLHLMGMDFNFGHYLAPYGLRVLDTRCYAVQLSCGKVRVLPHKLLRLKPQGEHGGDDAGQASKPLQQSVSLDLTGIARKVAEETLKFGDQAMLNDPTLWSSRIQTSLREVCAGDAFEGKARQRRLDRRLEEDAKAVGGGGGRVLSVTNAVEAGTCRQRNNSWA